MKKTGKIFWILLFLLVSSGAFSQAQVVDRIIAVINNDVITLSEFNAAFEPLRVRMMNMEKGQNTAQMLEQSRRELLERMISERLIEQESRRSGIAVKDDEVTAVVNDQLSRRRLTLDALQRELSKEGMTLEEYRKGIKDQLVKMKLVRRDVRAKVIVTPEEIGRYYEKYRQEYEGEEEVRIRQILIPLPRSADSRLISRLRQEAQEIRNRIRRGESFEAIAARSSAGAAAAQGGDLGFIGRGIMHPEVEEVAFKLAMDETSDVIESAVGFHIIKLVDRRGAGIKSLDVVQEEIRARIEEEKLEKKFEEWLINLRNKSYIDVRM